MGPSGFSGFSGLSGQSGFSGTGTSGFSGAIGKSGFSGTSGYSGSFSGGSGTSGFSGPSGDSGRSGYSGKGGLSGCSGFSGKSGASGQQGPIGASGTSGASGASGFSGAFSGISGFSGFSGFTGTSGFSGASSDTFVKRVKNSDQSNATTTLANDNTLFFNIGANEIWQVEYTIFWEDTGFTTNFSITGPASPTVVYWGAFDNNLGAITDINTSNPTETAFGNGTLGGAVLKATSAGAVDMLKITLLVSNGSNPGTLHLMFASAAGGETTVFHAGSNLIAHKLN